MLSKTTQNMASKRNLSLEVFEETNKESNKEETLLEVCGVDEYGEAYDEYHALYRCTSEGYFYVGTCFNKDFDFPNWIEDEKKLRSLLNDFSAVVNS